MSAYIVSDRTIAGMLQVVRLARYGIGVYWSGESYKVTSDNLIEVGQKLVNENYRSINYRYNEGTKPHEFSVMPLSMAVIWLLTIWKVFSTAKVMNISLVKRILNRNSFFHVGVPRIMFSLIASLNWLIRCRVHFILLR